MSAENAEGRPAEGRPADGSAARPPRRVVISSVTGEPIPVLKAAGDTVIGATINQTGAFRYVATKVGADGATTYPLRPDWRP